MRVASYVDGGAARLGLIDGGNRIVDVAALGLGLPSSMRELLELPGGLERLASADLSGAVGVGVEDVDFAPVVPDPHAIWCAALTFGSHVSEAAGRRVPDFPLFFLRVAESQVGHRGPLVRPVVSAQLDYEGELAVVIGRRARHVSVADARSCIAGYSCYNDGSVRDWQRHTPQITPGKNFQSTGAFGPWLVTPDEFGDPYGHTLTTRVNGEIRQRESLGGLLFRIEYLIHYLSTFVVLRPGDVVVCGTPGGVGLRREPPTFLTAGDVATVEIDGIGVLCNEVVDEVRDRSVSWPLRGAVGQ